MRFNEFGAYQIPPFPSSKIIAYPSSLPIRATISTTFFWSGMRSSRSFSVKRRLAWSTPCLSIALLARISWSLVFFTSSLQTSSFFLNSASSSSISCCAASSFSRIGTICAFSFSRPSLPISERSTRACLSKNPNFITSAVQPWVLTARQSKPAITPVRNLMSSLLAPICLNVPFP